MVCANRFQLNDRARICDSLRWGRTEISRCYRTGTLFGERNKSVIRKINFKRNIGHKTENQMLQNEKTKRNLLIRRIHTKDHSFGETYFIIIDVKYNMSYLDCESDVE